MYYYRNKKLADLYVSDTKMPINYPSYQDYIEISEEQFNLVMISNKLVLRKPY